MPSVAEVDCVLVPRVTGAFVSGKTWDESQVEAAHPPCRSWPNVSVGRSLMEHNGRVYTPFIDALEMGSSLEAGVSKSVCCERVCMFTVWTTSLVASAEAVQKKQNSCIAVLKRRRAVLLMSTGDVIIRSLGNNTYTNTTASEMRLFNCSFSIYFGFTFSTHKWLYVEFSQNLFLFSDTINTFCM